jgi:hypothetical protein
MDFHGCVGAHEIAVASGIFVAVLLGSLPHARCAGKKSNKIDRISRINKKILLYLAYPAYLVFLILPKLFLEI